MCCSFIFSLDFRSFQKFLERKTTHSQICNLKAAMLGSSEISSHCFFDLRFFWRNFCTLVTSSKFLKISFMILYEIDGFFLPKPENVWTNIDKDGPFVGTVFSSLKKNVVFTKPRRGWVLRLLPISPASASKWGPCLQSSGAAAANATPLKVDKTRSPKMWGG